MAGLRVTVVKPKKPLRYRLAPIEEKLDNLDLLEKEFALACKAETIPEEQRQEYALYLKIQRDKLQATKDKALGVKPEKPVVEKVLVDMTHERIPSNFEMYLRTIDGQKVFRVVLFIVVMLWFFSKK